MYKIVEPDKEEWNEFVSSNVKSNVFQSYEMKEVYDKTKNYETLLLAVKNDDKIVAGALVEIRKEKEGVLAYFATRALIEGGPVYTDRDAIPLLMKEIEKRLMKKVIYIHIFNEHNMNEIKTIMASLGYEYEEELNYLIDLDRPKEDIWKDINKSKRKCINRAKNKGVKIRKIDDKNDLDVFYELVLATYKRVKVPVAHLSLLQACFELENSDFYLAEIDGKAIGARAVIKYKDYVYDWNAGSSEKDYDKYPSDLLVWHILEENAGQYKIFDFQGAGKPGQNYGPGEFKRRFGGKEVNYGRYRKVLSKVRDKVTSLGFKLYQKVT